MYGTAIVFIINNVPEGVNPQNRGRRFRQAATVVILHKKYAEIRQFAKNPKFIHGESIC